MIPLRWMKHCLISSWTKIWKINYFFLWGFVTLNSLGFSIYVANRLRGTGTLPSFSNWLLCFCVLWEVNVVWAPCSFSSSPVNIQGLLGSLSLPGWQRPRSGWFVFSIGPAVPGLLFQGWKPQVWTLRQTAENKNVKRKVRWHFVGIVDFLFETIPAVNILT